MTILFKRMLDIDRKILVIPQLAENKADELRAQGIQFIDTAGNGYINLNYNCNCVHSKTSCTKSSS